MNILIVCLQGMTSGVMARRMNSIAEKRGDPYVFKSVGYTKLEEASSWADGVLLTPQASAHHAEWEEYLRKNHIPYWKLKAFTMSFDHIPETYEAIVSLVSTSAPVKEKLITIIAKDLLEQLILCTALILFGSLLFALHLIIPARILEDGFQLTTGSVCIYAAIFSGRQYAGHQRKNAMHYMMLSFVILMMLTPAEIHPQYGMVTQSSFLTALQQGYYRPVWLLLYLPACPFFLWIYDVMDEKTQHAFMKKRVAPTRLWIDAAFPGTIVMTFLLIIRIIISVLASA